MLKTKVLRCRINEVFTKDMLKAIHQVTDDPTIPDNNSKIDIINELLTRFEIDYVPIGPGTNRYAILIDGIVFKIALDDWGMRDNLNEFAMSRELQPYVIKVYEVNSLGTIMTCQYVTVIDKDEYLKQKEAILAILEDLSQSYLLGDVGYVSKNFLNWGYTDEGDLVILDFAYIYKVIAHELLCNNKDCISHPYLEYNSTYTELHCPECRKKYTFMDIRRRYNKKDEEDLIRLTKELSYKTQGKTYDIEVDVNEEKKPFEVIIDDEDDENALSNLTYEELNSNNKELRNIDIGVDKSMEVINSFVVQKDENIFDPDVLAKLEERRKNKEETNMSYFMEHLAELQSGKKKKEEDDFSFYPTAKPVVEEVEEEEQEDPVDAYTAMLNGFNNSQPQKKSNYQATEKIQENKPRNNNQQNKKKFNEKPVRNVNPSPKQEVKVEEKKQTPKRVIPTRNPEEVVNVNIQKREPVVEEKVEEVKPVENVEVTPVTQQEAEEHFNDIINELQADENAYSVKVPDEENPLDETKEVKGGETVTDSQKEVLAALNAPQQTTMSNEEDKAVIKNEDAKPAFSFTPAPSKESDIEALINSQKRG